MQMLASIFLNFKVQTASMTAIRFFKFVLKTNLERLKIPNKFIRIYGGGFSNPVFMKPPDGTEWKMYWTKQNGEVWLEKGWKQFVQNYSLDEGHLVVFKYEGASQFDVLILDQSALEIDYPFNENEKLDLSDDESVQILDEWPNHKKIKGEKASHRSSSLNWPKKARAQEIARNFISDNNFFTVVIKPVHVADGRMSVPDLKGCIEDKEKYVKLKIGERSWDVKLLAGASACRRFSAGWSLFASESELQPGDVCVFELINGEEFEVHVFKRQD